MKSLTAPAGWLTAVSVAAVAAVNVAGIWGIAVARRGAEDEAARLFRTETSSRARSLESLLTGTRADLAFLIASSPLAGLERSRAVREAAGGSGIRRAAEGALLLFLRGHPEVIRLVVRSRTGRPLAQTGRRGGVPVLWVSTDATGREGAATAPHRRRLTAFISDDSAPGTPHEIVLEAEVEPAALLDHGAPPPDEPRTCRLTDAGGWLLARHPAGPRPPVDASAPRLEAEAWLQAEGWSAPSPWLLACAQPAARAVALVEPVAERYRTTVALNLAVMGLALLLGVSAIQQARRRERLEARAREEGRVRELERRLFHAERLSTVGRLAAGIAHEINNPLEGMANYLSLAREELSRGEVLSAQRRLEGVREGLDRAAAIVRQVLAHADPATAPLTPVDLNRLLAETGEFVRSRREFQGIEFDLDLADGPLNVRGNPAMLGQVAVNLILNACEAQPRGGEVRVCSRREGSHVLFEVADRGPGVPATDRRRIFEPFFSTKDSTGLGLSICHSIARQHEGELSVSPREGGGAVFRMSLPALDAS